MVQTGLEEHSQFQGSSKPQLPKPGERQKIDLSAYSGSVIKVRFRATRGTDFYGDLAIDDVLFYKRSTIDVGAVAMTTPGTIGCFSAAEPVTITLLNDGFAPIDFTVNPATITVNVTGAGTQTLTTTVNTGTLAIGATQNVTVGNANMTAFGTYTFNASATATGDINTANAAMTAATRTLAAPVSLPQAVNFTGFTGTNLTTLFPNWYEASGATTPAGISSSWTSKTGLGGTSNITAKINLFSNTANEWIIGPKITATTATALKFKAAVTDYDALTPDATGMTGTDDKVQVMVSTDCGVTFTPVYTMDATSNLTNVLTSQTVSLATYAGQNIIVAFFATEGTINDTPDYDFHIDDINLLNLPPTDLELVSLTLPTNTCGMTATETICVTIRNSGSTAASNFPVSYVINTGTPVTETVTATIAPFTTAQYCFTTKANFLAVGTYSVTATVNATGDADASNNSVTGTATTTPMIATYPYSEGFENGAGGWTAAGTNSTWALGTPAGTVINSAAAGIKSWVTNLTGNYVDNEKSAVTGPCFNFSSLTNPVISMKIWWDTEFSWDGAVLQSSIDGGTTWQNVGAMNDPNNWYNDNTIGGNPGGQQIGWTGTGTTGSGGWVTASHALTGLGGQSLVRLRIAFASDGSTVKEGFAFDEINISDMVVVPTITAGGPTTFCTGGSVVLSAATTTPGATYTWALNGTAITGATSATYTATTSGNYTVTAALTGFVSSTSAATVVTVNAIPAVPTVTAGGATTFCQGGTVVLTAASTTTGVTYQWFLNGTAITGATAATYSATTAGSYTVEATNNGCSSAASTATAVTVNPTPSAPTITAGGPTTFCSGDSVVLTGASTTTGVTYQWLLNGTAINGATTATHAALTAGNYAIVAINASGCSDTSTVTAVTVNPTPATPTITQSGGSGQTLTSSATTGNQWFLNGQPISGATAQTYQTTANGTYAVLVTNTSGCSSDTSAAITITNTGIKDALAGMSVNVYPNPSNGKFSVKLSGYKQDAALELYSLTGQLIVKEEVKAGREVTQMQVKNLAAGTYLLKVVSEKGVQINKVVVE